MEQSTGTQPPYRRIVADIRRRIAAGELGPGDRVPSARQITREWGVAIATATRVLTALRQEGLVRTVPGVGTVVDAPDVRPSPPPPRPARRDAAGPEPDLTRDRIIRAAIAVADGEGLGALSMRHIATGLGVATMSLYRHVRGKDELVLAMADTVLGEHPLPPARPAGWRARLELVARLQWDIYQRHPWLAHVISMTRPQLLPNGMAHTEWALRATEGARPRPRHPAAGRDHPDGYVRGLATSLEMRARAEQDTGITDEQWMQTQESTFASVFSTGPFPTLARLATGSDVDLDLDTLFEFGLNRLLDGYAVLFEAYPR